MDLVLHGVDMLPATAAAGAPPPSALAHTASCSNSSRVRAAAGGGVGGSDPLPREASGHKAAGSSSSAGAKAAAAAAAASSDCFVIIQCGPYWAVSSARPCGPSPPRWALHLRLPLLHPATSLSLALFRRHEASSSRKLLSLMSPLAAPGEVLVGKLRLRAGALVPGRLVLAAALPLLGERSQSKGPLQTAVCHMSLKVTYPQLLPVLSAYLAPPLYAPLLLLAMGCTAGDDLQDPCLGNPGLAAPEEEQVRRLKRVALSWLNAGGPPPGIPYRAARRLLDDGRQDFSLSRTQQNWRRLTAVLGSAGPALQWWKEVQSWRNPLLSAAVAAGIVAAAAYPSRALALALLALALRLWYWKEMVLGEGCGQPLHMLVDASDTLPAAPTPAAPSASQQQQQQQQQQPGGMAGVQGAGAGSVDAEQLMDCAWGTHGSGAPAPAAAYAAPPSSSSPAAGGELEAGAAPLSASVPLDPLAAMRAQWDSMRGFMLTVQNVMDGVASAGERVSALLSWHDPTATTLLLLGLISGALLLWLAGLPVLMAAALLFDIRPPPFRDPFPPPPANLVAYMPCRADRMM
ncbi:plant phosphoribosyltransferase C-terminal-domain-containing protein [Haematococcus lacustris]